MQLVDKNDGNLLLLKKITVLIKWDLKLFSIKIKQYNALNHHDWKKDISKQKSRTLNVKTTIDKIREI